jgi:amino acid adenylation domain-containing protein
MSSVEHERDQVWVFKASEAQRSLWFLEQLAPGRSLYNLHVGKRITSSVDAGVMEASVNEVVRRHEALRTAFRDVDHETSQVIISTLHVPLRVTDLRHLPEDEREDEALAVADEEAGRPFDLTTWPLLRTRLVLLTDDESIFLLTIHHILCDYWSLQILEDELSATYAAFASHQPTPLDGVPLQYADFSEWERAWLAGPGGREQLDHWTSRLADLPDVQLPADHPRPRSPTFAGAALDFEVPQPTYDALRRIGHAEGATLFMVTLAALQTVLQRYTDSDDIVVGTSVANRAHADVERIVGYLVNTLVLRTDLAGDPTFRELVGRARDVAMDAYGHQQVPFNMVVSALRPERVAGDNPLFHVHFQFFSEGRPSAEAGLLAEEAFESEATTAQFDLGLDLWEGDGLVGHIEYSTELYAHETLERFAQHFLKVLEAVATDPDARIGRISLLDERDLERLAPDPDEAVVEPTTELLHRAFELEAARHPGTTAVRCGSERLTYAELDARADALAHRLRGLGVGPEDVVAISAQRSTAYVIGTLATLKAGAAFLPVNLLDPAPRLQRVLELARPRALVASRGSADHVDGHIPVVDPEVSGPDPEPADRPGAGSTDGSPDGLAYVISTSGSTGRPRGVQITHRAVTNHLRWMQEMIPLGPDDRALLKYPLTFDAAVCELFYPLLAGACLVVAPPAEHWNVSEFVDLCEGAEVTVLDVVPSMLDTLLTEPGFARCRSVRLVICGGEELGRELYERFCSQSEAELFNVYGPTELTIGATGWRCRQEHPASDVPIGRPVSNTRVYVLDRELRPVPAGVRGELCVAGAGLARGYLGDPAATAARFVPDPFATGPGARMYRTGDRGWCSPDGVLHYAGRMDHQVKVRGFRVESGEIETELARHPMVRHCSVVPVPDDRRRTRLVAYVLPTPPAAELWPSVGDYGVYDELLYYALTHDERRNQAYRTAIAAAVPDRVVVDLGTGADAILSRFAVAAGARHVYAVEVSEPAFVSARATVANLGLTDRITVLHGDSTQVALPEPADVCLSELIGMIGSSEGAVPILNDAWRLLKPDATMIPSRCVTMFAPFMLPANLVGSPRFTGLPRLYAQQVFAKVGRPFDLRVCIKSCNPKDVLADPLVFEDLDFTHPSDPSTSSEVTFTVSTDGRLDGFLLWLNLYPDQSDMVDSLVDRLSWLPVYLPAFDPGIRVRRGDSVRVRCTTTVPDGGRLPDYLLDGVVDRLDGEPLGFSVSSPNQTRACPCRATPFYDALLRDLGVGERSTSPAVEPTSSTSGTAASPAEEDSLLDLGPRLRQFLQQRLPDYMVPSSFVILDAETPLTSGKLDLRALARQHGSQDSGRRAAWRAPQSGAEETIAAVWCEVLNLSQVDRRDNFFDLGGDSLLITQVRAQLERRFSRPISIIELFRYPTVSALGAFLNDGHGPASRQSPPLGSGDAELEPALRLGRVGSSPG